MPKKTSTSTQGSTQTTSATFSTEALALGDSTQTTVEAAATTTPGMGTVDATSTAAGDSLATTTLTSSVYGADGGSGAGVETATSGTALGENSTSTSTTQNSVVTVEGFTIAYGLTSSTASGGTYDDAYASTQAYGDMTAGTDLDLDTHDTSGALSYGIAIDFA